MSDERYTSFSDFYPFYLSEHSDINCRRLHFAGLCLALLLLLTALLTGQWVWLLVALAAGYGCAWVGHALFEKNRPATFKYPLYSFMGDWVMFKDILAGKVRI